jgi:hypothetical protein
VNGFLNITIQALYRESKAQTDPWLLNSTQKTKPRAWFEEGKREKSQPDELCL